MVYQTSRLFPLHNLGCFSFLSSRPLEDGDIINIDITVYLDGYHGDTSETFLVGDVVGVNFHLMWWCNLFSLGCRGPCSLCSHF